MKQSLAEAKKAEVLSTLSDAIIEQKKQMDRIEAKLDALLDKGSAKGAKAAEK